MSQVGREALSLALIESRNRTLHLLSACERALDARPVALHDFGDAPSPLWLAGHIGWFSEWWIARNTRRASGIDCPPRPTRLAAIDPDADARWSSLPPPGSMRPDSEATRAYLLDTLECTLGLLERADESDAGLYFFRAALFHEDLCGEALVVAAQTLGLPIGMEPAPVVGMREPVRLPATRWLLGRSPDSPGFVVAQESGSVTVDVPEFEIDAQPVTWSQFVEFVDDGGYDRPDLWQPAGRDWLAQQVDGRRAPRHVESIGAARHGNDSGGAVLQRRFGQAVRVAGPQSAVHLSWWEADAWARWAGRRLATEVEWEVAAQTASRLGFRWGDVHEWTAGTLRPWTGYRADPWSAGTDYDPQSAFGLARVLRGSSFATHARIRSPRRRGFALPARDDGFFGFRTCAL